MTALPRRPQVDDPDTFYWCASCSRSLASDQVRLVPAGASVLRACPDCGGAVQAEISRTVEPFTKTLVGAFLWPIRPPVVYWTLGVAVACAVVGFFPLVGPVLAFMGQLGFAFLVIRRTGQGSEALESDVSGDAFDWLRPVLRYIAALIVSFGPGLTVLTFGGPSLAVVGLVLLGAGTLYLPAAVVVAAHSISATLNPLPGLGLIRRIPGPYFLTVLFLVVALSTHGLVRIAVHEISSELGPFVAVFAAPVLGMYPSIVCARMLGLLVREHAEEL